MASYLNHTATTDYLCCVPTLEGFSGAGCLGLAVAKIKFNIELKNQKHRILRLLIQK